VKYSNKQLLVIGSGLWPQKIKSILNANNHQVKINSIGARDFLSIDANNIKSYDNDQIVWIATIPTIQLEILGKIKLQSNRVIIEKPFATDSKELKSFIDLVKDSKNTLFYLNRGGTVKSGSQLKTK